MSPRPRIALLDVNVLVALFDPAHVHHDVAHDWFSGQRRFGWASCPLTENGFLRTASALGLGQAISVESLAAGLRTFVASGRHEFWSDDISLLDRSCFKSEALRGHQQLTDVYLLALAVRHQGLLATFDRRIPLESVQGATREHVAVLAPTE